MGFWMRLDAFFRFLCFLSKFPKLLCRRLNQNVVYAPQLTCQTSKIDLECRSSEKRESINLDSHFLAVERVRKNCGRPMREGDDWREKDRRKELPVENAGKQYPVHEVIELFDKPNEIQTSLPRYQNKTSYVEKGKTEGRKPQPLKMDKLKEQLQEKLMERLQRTKIERSICERQLEVIKPVMKSKSKGAQEIMTDCKRVSKTVTNEEEVIKDEKEREKLIGKLEKEKQNCLLKVNLSQPKSEPVIKSEPALLKPCMVKQQAKEINLLHTKRRFVSLGEVNYLRKSKERKSSSGYGGGWDCHRCGDRVYHAERMLACGNAYHKACFSCVNCKKLLGPRTYLETEMEIYCSQCHAKKCGLTGYGYGLGPGVLQTSP